VTSFQCFFFCLYMKLLLARSRRRRRRTWSENGPGVTEYERDAYRVHRTNVLTYQPFGPPSPSWLQYATVVVAVLVTGERGFSPRQQHVKWPQHRQGFVILAPVKSGDSIVSYAHLSLWRQQPRLSPFRMSDE